ncbi:MAG: tyrosine-type recombinase/integrase [Candidatus Latescibacterota bacterium]|nr:tyrosine-type recombinase/integrase [Candidatus Latescibacterota bacterium]
MQGVDECKAAFIKYLSVASNYSSYTVVSYETDIEQFLSFLKNQTKRKNPSIASADSVCVSVYKEELICRGLKNSTLARKLTALRTFFRFLCREKMIVANPTLFIKSLKIPPPKAREISLKNIEEAIEERPDDTFIGVRDRAILEVFYGGGIRLGELVMLNVTAVDLKAGLLCVGNKKKEYRTTPIGRPAVEALVVYVHLRGCLIKELGVKKPPETLFLGINAKPLSRRAIQKRISYGLGRIVDSKTLNPNILRQSFKAHLLNSGADLASVRYMLGQVVMTSATDPKKIPIERLREVYAQAHPRSD